MHDEVEFLEISENKFRNFPARKLAYNFLQGKDPVIIWLGGFRSDMSSTKAESLYLSCIQEERAFLRFDYYAHGQSQGNFLGSTISLWLDDALHMIEKFGGKSPIIVGSSMGGWIALRAIETLKKKNIKPCALVLIAPAIDFTQKLMWEQFPTEIRNKITNDGIYYRPSEYSNEPYPITKNLIEDGRENCLWGKQLSFEMPIHIIQGIKDPDVPHQHVQEFFSHYPQEDIRFTFIPDGDHRLSREQDISALQRIVFNLAQ